MQSNTIKEYFVYDGNYKHSPGHDTWEQADNERRDLIDQDKAQGWPHTEDSYEIKCESY